MLWTTRPLTPRVDDGTVRVSVHRTRPHQKVVKTDTASVPRRGDSAPVSVSEKRFLSTRTAYSLLWPDDKRANGLWSHAGYDRDRVQRACMTARRG